MRSHRLLLLLLKGLLAAVLMILCLPLVIFGAGAYLSGIARLSRF